MIDDDFDESLELGYPVKTLDKERRCVAAYSLEQLAELICPASSPVPPSGPYATESDKILRAKWEARRDIRNMLLTEAAMCLGGLD